MKNLDLNAYGVEEMNAVEMQKTDGGFGLYRGVVRLLEIVGVLEVAEALIEGFIEGVGDGYNDQQNR